MYFLYHQGRYHTEYKIGFRTSKTYNNNIDKIIKSQTRNHKRM